jgi:hypothetical protein
MSLRSMDTRQARLVTMLVIAPTLVIASLSQPAEWLTVVLIVCTALLGVASAFLLWLLAQDPCSPAQKAAAAESDRLE